MNAIFEADLQFVLERERALKPLGNTSITWSCCWGGIQYPEKNCLFFQESFISKQKIPSHSEMLQLGKKATVGNTSESSRIIEVNCINRNIHINGLCTIVNTLRNLETNKYYSWIWKIWLKPDGCKYRNIWPHKLYCMDKGHRHPCEKSENLSFNSEKEFQHSHISLSWKFDPSWVSWVPDQLHYNYVATFIIFRYLKSEI